MLSWSPCGGEEKGEYLSFESFYVPILVGLAHKEHYTDRAAGSKYFTRQCLSVWSKGGFVVYGGAACEGFQYAIEIWKNKNTGQRDIEVCNVGKSYLSYRLHDMKLLEIWRFP